MRRVLIPALLLGLAVGCSDITGPIETDRSAASLEAASATAAKKSPATPARPIKMSKSRLDLVWGIERDQEVACQIALGAATSVETADHIAGGEIAGEANITHLGKSKVSLSAAWDIGNLISGDPQFTPASPNAAGPVAPVLSGGAYPYEFHVDPSSPPFAPTCAKIVSATGELVLTAANGDEVHGVVVGGETHRLDFVNEGDGIETFAIIDIMGGTGRFANASGSLVVHTITRFDYSSLQFVIDLAEVLPGGTISY